MRILRVVHRLYPPKLGGLSLYAHQLSRDQARLGHKVVALTTLESNLPHYEVRDGYEIHRYAAALWPLENPITVSMLPAVLRASNGQFDILHAHSHLIFTTNLAALRRQLNGIPFVITNHGFQVERGRMLGILQKLYLNSAARWNLCRADAVISFTAAEACRVVSLGVDPAKSVVIPNGVDTELFRPYDVGLREGVVWVGRFVPEKGLRYLIEAMVIVKREVRDAKLKLAGYGPERDELEALARKLGLDDCVEFLGTVEQSRLPYVLSQAEVFVLPSLAEGTPTTLLEAMACGKPLIVTKGIGLEEVAADSALYVPPRSSDRLASVIVSLLQDASRSARLGDIGRRRVEKKFSWKRIVEAVNLLFERLVADRH